MFFNLVFSLRVYYACSLLGLLQVLVVFLFVFFFNANIVFLLHPVVQLLYVFFHRLGFFPYFRKSCFDCCLTLFPYLLTLPFLANISCHNSSSCFISRMLSFFYFIFWSFCRGIRCPPPTNERSGYDTKQSDGETPVKQEL